LDSKETRMTSLILMRHAKSDRSQGALGDFGRVLNKRGRRAAPLVAKYLRDNGLIPDFALVSSAARTKETWERMIEAFDSEDIPCEYLRELYLAQPQAILGAIRTAPTSASRVLVLGHNPGIELTAVALAAPGQDAEGTSALAGIKDKFPTAAFALFDFA